VAPELRRDIVSALFVFKWIKTWTVIDFRVDMYTLELLGLISADLIRLRENPVHFLLPLRWQVSPCSLLTRSSIGLGGLQLDLLQ